ncbi:MAG: NADH-quinone oxidoreductase subunit NuoE [Alphaproteobacteria bacterium]|nr:NADH-quinone oxidoreductase subunit NuoE [Alphaproteobacteria bacterium]
MAVRRPAKDQPASFEWTPENAAWCAAQMKKYPAGRQASCVIPFLWRGQKQDGWISIPMMEAIAEQLSMPYIRVYEVASFYTMFNLAPVGERFVQVCGTTPCMLRGANSLKDVCKRVIGPENRVTDDGKLSWLEVECLGACVNAPMIQVSTRDSDHYYEDLTPEILEDMLAAFRAGEAVKAGTANPQRHTSDPEGDDTTLMDPSLYDGSRARPIGKLPNSDTKPAAG